MSSAAATAAAAGAGSGGSWVTLSRLLVAAGVGFGLLALKRYANGPLSPHTPANTDMTGKVVVITGGNAGLGRATAAVLMRMNATVVLACRDAAKAAKAAAELRAEVAADAKAAAAAGGDAKAGARVGSVEPMALDVSDLQSVRAFASAFKAKYSRLHVLLNNAGIYDTAARTTTAAGHETLIATNHIGPFLLTTLLLDTLTASAPSRVVTVSSGLEATASFDLSDLQFERRAYANAYAQSKLCNILFARELARRTQGTGVLSVSLRPGFVPSTEMSGKIPNMQWLYRGVGMPLLWPISKDLPHGIATIVHCCAAPHTDLVNGAYYGDCAVTQPRHKLAADDGLARKLWEHTEQLVAAGAAGAAAK